MRTTLDLPEDLVQQASRFSHEKTKRGAVMAALREYIRLKKLEKLARSAGTIRIDPSYNWEKVRHGR